MQDLCYSVSASIPPHGFFHVNQARCRELQEALCQQGFPSNLRIRMRNISIGNHLKTITSASGMTPEHRLHIHGHVWDSYLRRN